jgi:hypothetical protein
LTPPPRSVTTVRPRRGQAWPHSPTARPVLRIPTPRPELGDSGRPGSPQRAALESQPGSLQPALGCAPDPVGAGQRQQRPERGQTDFGQIQNLADQGLVASFNGTPPGHRAHARITHAGIRQGPLGRVVIDRDHLCPLPGICLTGLRASMAHPKQQTNTQTDGCRDWAGIADCRRCRTKSAPNRRRRTYARKRTRPRQWPRVRGRLVGRRRDQRLLTIGSQVQLSRQPQPLWPAMLGALAGR